MMDWTDRHCRFFHRQISNACLLYTEMVTAPALVRGGAVHLLDHDPREHPVALQLGGSDPAELAQAARMGYEAGYPEINLNCGCPSDRVQSGSFAEVTVKCRIGVDEQEPSEILPRFLSAIHGAGVQRVTIHARKAWLQGLSPKENRDIPPLDYPLVLAMKAAFPDMHISLNGGVEDLDTALGLLDEGLDGVMIGRAAYQRPWDILAGSDARIFGRSRPVQSRADVVARMLPYIETQLGHGARLAQITRHMLGLFAGQPGARHWRRILSENAHKSGAGPELLEQALAGVAQAAA